MRVLVLNPGSSSLKYRLLDPAGLVLADGSTEEIRGDAVARAAEVAVAACLPLGIDAVGCRVVHGGADFDRAARVDAGVLASIDALGRLAPLHNPVAAAVLREVTARLPATPVVAVFDTAFHRTMPAPARTYAVPRELSRRHHLQRYGAHGIAYAAVSRRLRERLGAEKSVRLVLCHLGNGASACAVRDGKSVETTMGLTPLEGLVMGTRSGDVDPALVTLLMREAGMSADAVDSTLTRESGLKGMCGHSDLRDVFAAADAGDGDAALAADVFAHRVRKAIGSLAATLGGIDALAFSGGIGEHSARMRRLICRDLAFLGVTIDDGTNDAVRGESLISNGPVPVLVVPADEAAEIARQTAEVVAG